MRVVMPLAAPVARDDWETVWYAANVYLGGYADMQTKNIDRFWYLPCVNVGAPAWAQQDGGCWFE